MEEKVRVAGCSAFCFRVTHYLGGQGFKRPGKIHLLKNKKKEEKNASPTTNPKTKKRGGGSGINSFLLFSFHMEAHNCQNRSIIRFLVFTRPHIAKMDI